MTADEKGVWTITLPPVVPGFHYYWFLVDGVAVNDPAARPSSAGAGRPAASRCPRRARTSTTLKDVPHGEVRSRWYRSKMTGHGAARIVYTPPGYDRDPKTRYPGALPAARRRRERDRLDQAGPRELILDNLIAAGRRGR